MRGDTGPKRNSTRSHEIEDWQFGLKPCVYLDGAISVNALLDKLVILLDHMLLFATVYFEKQRAKFRLNSHSIGKFLSFAKVDF